MPFELSSLIFQLFFTTIARLLVTVNSSLNPMVYATTIPNFKKTLRKIKRHQYKNDSSTGKSVPLDPNSIATANDHMHLNPKD